MKTLRRLVLAYFCTSLISIPGRAADTWLLGTIDNITSVQGALMIHLDTGVPTNCTGTPYGWMAIRETDKAIVALALTTWATGSRVVTVYTTGLTYGGYCEINQLDPV